MKAIWLALCATILGISFYPGKFQISETTINLSAFWASEAIPARICQGLLIVSFIGFLRDLGKYKGSVTSRLVKRSFINLGFITGLYVPWSLLGSETSVFWKIGLSLAGAIIWFIPFVFLMADGYSDPSIQNKVPNLPTNEKTSNLQPLADSSANTWAKFANLMAERTGQAPPFEDAVRHDVSSGRSYDSLNGYQFLLQVEDIFEIKGRGTVVTGQVSRGKIRVNDEVEIHGLLNRRICKVIGIEQGRNLLDSASQGQGVGLMLRGVSKAEIRQSEYVVGN